MLIAGLIDILAVVTVAANTPVFRLRHFQINLFDFNFMPARIEVIQRGKLSQRR